MALPSRPEEWRALLGVAADEVPELVLVEGSWWRADREAQRLALLDDVRPTAVPDWWWGTRDGRPVLYACLYGGVRAVEPVHVCAQVNRPAVVVLGSCGGIAPGLRTGAVVVPSWAVVEEGTGPAYGAPWGSAVHADPGLVQAAAQTLRARGVPVSRGQHLTTAALLEQPDDVVDGWRRAGHLSVDLETSAVLAAARRFGLRAAALLHVWDELPGRSWADPLPPDVDARRRAAEAAIAEVALAVGLDVGLGARRVTDGSPD